MSSLQKSMQAVVEQLEQEGKGVKNLAELEQLVLKYQQQLSQTAFAELSKDVQERISPLGETLP